MVREERIVEEELNLRVVFGAGLEQGMVRRKLVYRMVGGYLRGRIVWEEILTDGSR
jgi:hypothetical protein